MADDPRPPSLPPEDLQFAELVVTQGICSREAVGECLSFLGRLIADGITPVPRLGELLVRRGLLSVERLNATHRPASSGAELDRIQDLPPEVAEAARDPANNLGKYVKADRLGAGGMGEVWRGWDRELRRWVALKFLHYEDPGQLARFRREAQTAAALNHPHIASVYEVGESKGRPFIAMQYIAGLTLDAVPRNDPRVLVGLLRDAALAIHYAHEKGVIHRDLKPANLMVETSGGKPRIYVMDFGLAKPTALGTPAYMAPEQALGESLRVGARSDVYALGATLYELFADRPPFQETEVYALLRKVVDEDPLPLRRRNPRIDRDLETIVMKCLEKDPDRRYASADELAQDLARWLEGEAIQAHPPSAGYKLRKFIGRRKALLAVAAAGLVVASVFLATTLRERSEKEALRDLGELRAKMLQVKEWIRQDFRTSGDIRGALEQETHRLSDFIGRHPRLPQGWFVRAQGELLQGRLEKAEQDLEEALRLEARFAPGWQLLARVKLERYMLRLYGDPTVDNSALHQRAAPFLREAEEAFRKGSAEAAAARSLETWGLARLAEDAVNDKLIEAFRLTFTENNEDAGRAVLEAAFRQAPSEEYGRWIAAWTEDLDQRHNWLEKSVYIAPHSAVIRSDLACVRYMRRNWDAAIEEATRAIELNPYSTIAYCARAASWIEKRDYDRSIEDCTRAIELDPRFAVPYATRAGAKVGKADYEGAYQDATRSLELDPKYPLAYANRAGASISRGDAEPSLKDCDRALALDPKHVLALSNRAGAQVLLGNWEAALQDANLAIELNPAFALAYANRGSAKGRLGDADAAIADYTRAVELDPGMALAYANRAGFHLAKEQWDDAIRDCNRAIDLNARLGAAYCNRGNARRAKGENAEAVADATKAIELGWTTLEPYIVRAQAQAALKNRAASIADFEKALKLAPANWPYRAEVEGELKQVREGKEN
jgi:tetratricopeptide (TPR) repeat protein